MSLQACVFFEGPIYSVTVDVNLERVRAHACVYTYIICAQYNIIADLVGSKKTYTYMVTE